MVQIAPKVDIERIRETVHLSDIISQYVTLKNAGAGTKKGLCPFHDEKSPSFTVNDNSGFYHCFGCSESGDIFSFVMKLNGIGFTDAIKYIAEKSGIVINWENVDRRNANKSSGSEEISRTDLIKVNLAAKQIFEQNLKLDEANLARQMLEERNFTKEGWEEFGCGYALKGWDNLVKGLANQGFSLAVMDAAGLITKTQNGNHIDRFRGRLIWPISETSGDIIGFGARKLYDDDDGPKYLNTPETKVYKKNRVLYGIDKARKAIAKKKICVVTEGYTDVMAMHFAGIETAVASCGTAFGEGHIQVVNRLMGESSFGSSVDHPKMGKVILVFDGDEAGMNAARKSYQFNQEFAAQANVVILPEGLDPCDFRKLKGDKALIAQLHSAKPLYDYIFETTVNKFPATADGFPKRLKASIPIVSGIKDIVTREAYIRKLQIYTGYSESEIRKSLKDYSSKAKPEVPQNEQVDSFASEQNLKNSNFALTTASISKMPQDQLEILAALIQLPEFVNHDLIFEIDSDLFVYNFRLIFETILNLGGTVIGSSMPVNAWANMIINNLNNDDAKKLVSLIATYNLRITENTNKSAYAAELINSFNERSKKRKLTELRQILRVLDPTSDEYKQKLHEITILQTSKF